MPTRIEIELTSTTSDGSWTWRAAGAKNPRGILDGSILPSGTNVGDQVRVEVDQDLDGIHVLSVLPSKEKEARDLLELLPSAERFEPVVEHRAPRGGGDDRRGPRRDGDRRERRDRGDRPDRPDRGDRAGRGDRGERGDRASRPGGRPEGADAGAGPAPDRRSERSRGGERRSRPHFTPPPEVPQRPKPKRLRPGKEHRGEVLASLAEEQRPVAELALQGLAAVRQRLREDNARLKAEGKPEMPEAGVMRMAEELLPRLRVADWLDRAAAAKRQLEHLDLRDLRSVVVAGDDPVVARDETTRELASELKQALVTKQESELALWLGDVEAALDVGRVVRALRLSSQPPKAGVPFPPPLAARLGEAATQSLQPTDSGERWIAVLEAAAFSPVRTQVTPPSAPPSAAPDLVATVKRLGPLLPQVAAVFGIDVPTGAHVPKPLRPTPHKKPAKAAAAKSAGPSRRQPADAPADHAAAAPPTEAATDSMPDADTPVGTDESREHEGPADGQPADAGAESRKDVPPAGAATDSTPASGTSVEGGTATPGGDESSPASTAEPDTSHAGDEAAPAATIPQLEPEPVPEPEPLPKPEPIPDPEPEPIPLSSPEPDPEPSPEPEPVAPNITDPELPTVTDPGTPTVTDPVPDQPPPELVPESPPDEPST